MGLARDVEAYREYVAGRLHPMRRTAYLLCGDWHTADDLLSTALAKLFRHWGRVVVSNFVLDNVGSAPSPSVTRREPMLTLDQMVVLGTTPGLTLYP